MLPFQHDAFISYKSEDRARAERIRAFLMSHGVRCWISHIDIPPGCDYSEEISKAIKNATTFLLVFSDTANRNGTQIKKEVSIANQFKRPIIPVRLDNIEPENGFDYHFANVQILDVFSSDPNRDLQDCLRESKLLEAIDFYLKKNMQERESACLERDQTEHLLGSEIDVSLPNSPTLMVGSPPAKTSHQHEHPANNWPSSSFTDATVFEDFLQFENLIDANWGGKTTDAKARPSHFLKVSQVRAVRIHRSYYRGATIQGCDFLLTDENPIRESSTNIYEIEVFCLWYRWKPKSSWMRLKVAANDFEVFEAFSGHVVVNISRG